MAEDISEAAWSALMALAARPGAAAIRPLFAADPNRFARYSRQAGDVLLDFSKTAVSDEVLAALLALAEARDVAGFRARLFAGAAVNETEGRAALHMALRAELIFGRGTQRHMQRRAAFGGIHRSTRKKPRAEARDIRGLGKREQCLQYRIRNRGFGEIEQHIASLARKRCEAIRISGEKRANSGRIRPFGQSHQRRPGGFARIIYHRGFLPCLRGETMAEGRVI